MLIVGSIAFDTITTPFGRVNEALGGSAVYASLAAGFFTRPCIVAAVGDDFSGTHLAVLQKAGADTQGLIRAPGKTFRWGGEYGFDLNERSTLFTELNVLADFKPELSDSHKDEKFVLLGNMDPKLQLEVLGKMASPSLAVLDTMNFWIESANSSLLEAVRKVNAFILNDSEARELSKEHNLLKAAKKISSLMDAGKSPLLIIKRGEYGLLMFKDKQIFHLPGFPLEDVTDPTGAGDSFAGGFLGHLEKTGDLSWNNLKKACVYGSVMASFCVESLGTKRLQEVSQDDITKRYQEFRQLTHFEV